MRLLQRALEAAVALAPVRVVGLFSNLLIVIQHRVQRGEAPIVHIWGGERDIAQGGHPHRTDPQTVVGEAGLAGGPSAVAPGT